MTYRLPRGVFAAVLVAACALLGAADNPPAAHRYHPFGTEGETTPEMLAALNRMSEACIVAGRRGSLGHFRWSGTPPKLTHLGLWGVAVTNEIVALSTKLPDLAFVSVYESSLDDAGVEVLTRLPNLRYLAITRIDRYVKPGMGAPQWSYPFIAPVADRPRVTGAGLRTLATIRGLEGLDLLDVRLNADDLTVLAEMPKLGSLSLPLVVDEAVVAQLKRCRRLSSLTLGNRAITAEEMRCLATWPGLRTLTVAHATLSDDTLQALALLPAVQNIELIDCQLTDERLQHFRPAPKLTRLNLQRNEIAGTGLKHLVPLNLAILHLGHNNLSDATLGEIPQLRSLDELVIAYCIGVTDRGLRSGILQGMTHLKKLELRGLTKVTDAAYDDLVRLAFLSNLGIRETKTSAETVERLKRAMPMTVVFK